MVAHIERLQPVIDWLACPVCARQGCWQRLTADGTSLVCPHRHTIDVARQGYATMTAGPAGVNADTAAMLDARTRVLSSGLLDPVDDLLARRLHGAQRILEVGAGTGFHLAAVLDRLGAPAQGLATDISPAAVRRAAVAHPRMSAVVADTWQQIPLRDGQVDAIMCIFAPRNRAEFARVLPDGGTLVVVTPMADHLMQLRDLTRMISVAPHKQSTLLASLSGSFEPVARDHIRRTVTLDPDLAADVVAMGPSAHHAAAAHLDDSVDVTVALEVTTLRRTASHAAMESDG